MGASQRRKGAVYEREVAAEFGAALGANFARNIGQARDGGNDLDVGPLVVECKRRKRLATLAAWMEQAHDAAHARWEREGTGEGFLIPVVVCREDQGHSLVVLALDDFLWLAGNELRALLPDADVPNGEEGA